MIKKANRATARIKRHMRIRNKISGTAQQPRLAVFRSNQHMYAQLSIHMLTGCIPFQSAYVCSADR